MTSASATIPVGYKQTEVGVIPEDWEVGILSQFVIEHKSGIFKNKTEYGTGTNIVGVANIYDIECIDGQEFNLVNLSNSELSQYTLKENDLLYNESSLVKEGIARTVFVTKKGEGTAFAWHTRKFCVDQKVVHSPYLYFYLQSKPARRFLESVCIQTALTGINTVQFFRCPLILPPLEEQHIIAETTKTFSKLIQSLEGLLEKKRDIKQGTMQELLSGKTRLPGYDGAWSYKKLGEIGVFSKGRGVSAKESQTGDIPCIRYGEIYTHHHDVITKFTSKISEEVAATSISLKSGDILFAGSGETREDIGKCVAFINDFQAYAGGDIVILRPKDMHSEFLGFYLNSKAIRNQKANLGQGDAVVHIYSHQLSSIAIRIPEINEQQAIAEVLLDMDAEIAALEQRLEKTKAIKQGMMQQLLTGRIRLVDPSTPVGASA